MTMPNKDSAKLREQLHDYTLCIARLAQASSDVELTNDIMDEFYNVLQAHTAAQVAEAEHRIRHVAMREAYESERHKMSDYIERVTHPVVRVLRKHKGLLTVEQLEDIRYGGEMIEIIIAAHLTTEHKDKTE